MLRKKDCVSVIKGVHKQKLCNLQELYTTFKEKLLNVNIGFSKFCTLRPKWCVLAGSKMTHSVCVCSAHQNFVLLVDAMDWDLTYKDLITKIVSNPESNKCMMHRCESCLGTAILNEFLDQELSEHEDDKEFNWKPLQLLKKNTRDFNWRYWWFSKIFLYRQVSSTISKMTKETFRKN